VRAIREAYLELLSQGMTSRAACRRVGVSDSAPFAWADADAEFAAAWAEKRGLRYNARVVIRGDWADELIDDLIYQGHVAEDVDREPLRLCLVRFFQSKGVLEKRALQKTYNNSPFPRDEQKRIVERYIELKKGGADCIALGEYLKMMRVSRTQIKRWSLRHVGHDALQVGLCAYGATKAKIVRELQSVSEPLGVSALALRLQIKYNTVQAAVRGLCIIGRVKKIKQAGRAYLLAA